MEAKLYRSIVRDVATGSEIAVMKLVIEEQELFSSGGLSRTTVSVIAYSTEKHAEVEYVTFEYGLPAGAAIMRARTSELLDAHARGEDALRSYLFETLRKFTDDED